MEHPCHRVVADGGLEGVQSRPVPQVEGLLPTPKAFPSGGRWAGPPGWFWWRAPSEALGWGCRRQVVRLGPAQVSTCEVVPRPVPGGGSRLSLEKARTQRVAGGCPPPPLGLGPARWHSLVLALGATLFRSCVYFEAHLRALIWRLSFIKCFFSIFSRKMRPKSVLGYRKK